MIEKKQNFERIAKRISRSGVASRRESERLINSGLVTLNGVKVSNPAIKVCHDDQVVVKGKLIPNKEPTRLWLYHKPSGLVTSHSDEKGRATVFDQLPDGTPKLISIGRLDLNSEGLLLLTNNGELKRYLELPSMGFARKYRVRARGKIEDESLDSLRNGVTINKQRFKPMSIRVDKIMGSNCWLSISLTEGKNREVRKGLESVGLLVNRLIRISYGPFFLGKLKRNNLIEVRAESIKHGLPNFKHE